jgi:hypothetical protein
MIPQVIVLQPGLVIYKVDNGDWFFARRTLEDLRSSALAPLKKKGAEKKQRDRDTCRNNHSAATCFLSLRFTVAAAGSHLSCVVF